MKIGFEMYDMQSTGAPAAVIAEPVISAGGVIVPPAGYFAALQAETRKRGMLLIFDEAQTAFGRLGHWFAASHLQVTPDIMTVSKTLGGGMPLAGVITTDEIEERCHRARLCLLHVACLRSAAVGGGSRRPADDRGGRPAPSAARRWATISPRGSQSCKTASRRSATSAAWACCAASSSSATARRASPITSWAR